MRRDGRTREAVALGVAVVVHVGLVVVVQGLDEQRMFQDVERVPVEIEWIAPEPTPPPEPPPDEPEPEPEPQDEPEPPKEPVPEDAPEDTEPAAPVEPEVLPDAPVEPAPTEPDLTPLPPAPVLPEGSDSPLRLPEQKSLMGRVLGEGEGPLGLGLKDLEGGLSYKADGPQSDRQRAEKKAVRMIQDEMARDAVDVGLVDDYFRTLRGRVLTAWRPAKKQLNDGGRRVEHLGFARDAVTNAEAYGELWSAYLDVAQQYARGQKLHLDKKRAQKIRELFRSRQGNFRFHAIAEVVVTQAADGQVLTIETPLPSGHPLFDEGVRDAFMTAAEVMPDKPPERFANGRAFRSRWRLRATWKLIPPTALLSGSSWDLTPKGVELDVPFQIKLSTRVLLVKVDNRDHSIAEGR